MTRLAFVETKAIDSECLDEQFRRLPGISMVAKVLRSLSEQHVDVGLAAVDSTHWFYASMIDMPRSS